VLFCHHTTKASRAGTTDSTAARGSSAFTDGARWQANIDTIPDPEMQGRALPDLAEFHVTKNNYGTYPAPLPLRKVREHKGALVGEPDIAAELAERKEDAKKAAALERARDKKRADEAKAQVEAETKKEKRSGDRGGGAPVDPNLADL